VNIKLNKPVFDCKKVLEKWGKSIKLNSKNEEDCGFCEESIGKDNLKKINDLLKN
jgi:hypothetical protein